MSRRKNFIRSIPLRAKLSYAENMLKEPARHGDTFEIHYHDGKLAIFLYSDDGQFGKLNVDMDAPENAKLMNFLQMDRLPRS